MRRKKDGVEIKVTRGSSVPKGLEKAIAPLGGHNDTADMLREIDSMVQSGDMDILLSELSHYYRTTAPMYSGVGLPDVANPSIVLKPTDDRSIEPMANLVPDIRTGKFLSDYRPDDRIPIHHIDRMQQSAPCVLAARIKKGPIFSALSSARKWSLHAGKRKLRAVASANLRRVFLHNLGDMLTCMDYGAAFGAMRWIYADTDYIGVEESGVGGKWWVVDDVDWAHPSTIHEIRRDDDYRFRGFVHERMSKRKQEDRYKIIPPPQAIVLTYGRRFGNMWGRSIFEPAYDPWLWYEVIMRFFVRFLERMGTPVTVCKAPSTGRTQRPDGTIVRSAEYALLVAGAAANHNAMYIPSDIDPETKQPLWAMEYLEAKSSGQQFTQALQYLASQIMRAVIVGDQAATQSNDVGSYAAASVHDSNTKIDDDMIFKGVLGQLNRYWVPRYGQFNEDPSNPGNMYIAAQVMDPMERDTLMKLFATAGNVKTGDGTPLDWIDWPRALTDVYAPVLSEEEYEKQYEEMMERKKEAQEQSVNIQAKAAEAAAKRNGDSQSAFQKQPKPGDDQKKEKDVSARISVIDQLASGNRVPILLTLDQVRDIVSPRQESISLGRRAPVDVGEDPDDPEFEKRHPRDEHGRFAKKEKRSSDEDENGEEGGDDDDGPYAKITTDDLDELPWPGAGQEIDFMGEDTPGVSGVFELDGVKYTVMEGVTKDQLLNTHAVVLAVKERGPEVYDGYELSPIVVMPENADTFQCFAEPLGDGKAAYLSVESVDFPEGTYETITFHEILHAQERSDANAFKFRDDSGGVYVPNAATLMPEEAFNGIICNEYAQRFGTSVLIGWGDAVTPVATAAMNLGWSVDALHDFAKDAHRIDGDQYAGIINRLFNESGVSAISKSTWSIDALDQYWSAWWDDTSAYYKYKKSRTSIFGIGGKEYEDRDDFASRLDGWPRRYFGD